MNIFISNQPNTCYSFLVTYVQALIKKHEAVELEIEGYGGKVQELVTESQTLLNREHFDQDMIQQKQVSVYDRTIVKPSSVLPHPKATFNFLLKNQRWPGDEAT